jgi:hypothetical protein
MYSTKKRDRTQTEQVSPPHKMAKNNKDTQPSNSDLMDQLARLVEANEDVLKKIDSIEKRFEKVEKFFDEVESLKRQVAKLSKPLEGLRRLEVEQKKKSILVKGLTSPSRRKYETRSETYQVVQGLFDHIGLNLTLEDYQRLGPLKPDDTGSTMVRLQFWSKDDKSLIFSKFKEFSQDERIKKVSLINDYPLFQLADVKRLSNEAYAIRQKDKSIKTRIVPRGLEVQLQQRNLRDPAGKWMTVNTREAQNEA